MMSIIYEGRPKQGRKKIMKSRKSISPGIPDFKFQDGPATGNTLTLSVEYQTIIHPNRSYGPVQGRSARQK
jgi:hypothetical protein